MPDAVDPLVLFDFSDPDAAAAWRSVDDVVMGGVSSSRMEPAEGTAVFTGRVSLEQGGGFASVRSPDDAYDLSAYGGLQLRVRGDRKTFQLVLHTADAEASYRVTFTPGPTWRDYAFAFEDFEPRFRGRPAPQAPPLHPARVRSVGFLIADKQDGPFALHVAWLRAVPAA